MRTATSRLISVGAALLVAVLSGSSGNAAGPGVVGPTATPTAQAVRAPFARPPGPVADDPALLISDSAWLGLYLYGGGIDSVRGFDHTLALASCRRRVVPSCTHSNGYRPITLVEELNDHPDGFGTLIVATGYNDDDRAFRDEVDTIVDRARSLGYQRVVWLTLRSNVSYVSPDEAGVAAVFVRNNATLQEISSSGAHPELVVADWASYARDRPAWFSSDGIHLRPLGTYAAGDYLSRKMAFLNARPCPAPLVSGGTVFDPCPDPDVQGALIDVRSVYPVDQPFPRPPFMLRFEGSSSWPDPPWWES